MKLTSNSLSGALAIMASTLVFPAGQLCEGAGDLDEGFGNGGVVLTNIDSSTVPALTNEVASGIAIQDDGRIIVVGGLSGGGAGDFAVARYHADGTLDTTFSDDGLVTTNFKDSVGEGAGGVALQADGRIIVVGRSDDDFAVARYHPDGTLDTSFAGDGKVTTDFDGGRDYGYGVAVQNDGRIVVVGWRISRGFAVARYNADGSLDTTFSGDGKTTTNMSGSSSQGARNVAIQPDGRIVVAGHDRIGSSFRFAVVRYDTDGALDPSFSGDGIATTAFNPGISDRDFAHSVAVQSDGKIVVVGSTQTESRQDDFAVARYNADGSLDTTFSEDGMVTTDIDGDSHDSAYAVKVLDDGKIVVAGAGFAVVRYHSDGSLDTTFSGDGKVTANLGTGYGTAIQDDGSIVVAGGARPGTSHDFAVARYDPDGNPDSGFSGDGMAVTAFSLSSYDYGESVAVQDDGGILVAGRSDNGGQWDLALARHLPDGSLDTGFSNDGTLTTDFDGLESRGSSVKLQGDGKILVAGRVSGGDSGDFALARYNADGTPDTMFSGDGRVTTDFSSAEDIGYDIAVQGDGRILVIGSSTVGSDADLALARYDANGSLDTTFSTDGKATIDFGSTWEAGESIAVQADGRILAAGHSDAGFALARYNADGTLDTTFSEDGLLTTGFDGEEAFGRSVALQTDGRILLGGTSHGNGGARSMAVARYNSDGTLDPTFSEDGKVLVDFGHPSECEALAVQSDGKIVVAGNADRGNEKKAFAVARLNPDGTLDTTLSSDGKVTVALSERTSYFGRDVALHGEDRIVLVGAAPGVNSSDFALLAFDVKPTPEIFVIPSGGSYALVDGEGEMEFGYAPVGESSPTRTVVVRNLGGIELEGIAVSASGAASADYVVDDSDMSTTLASGASTSFTVSFIPTVPGTRIANLQIASNDADENPFDILLEARGLTALENWRFGHFGRIDDSGNAADDLDFENDGLANLLEWALDLDPTAASQLPFAVSAAEDHFEFLYTRSTAAAASGAQFVVQWNATLRNSDGWSADGVSEEILSDDGTIQDVKANIPIEDGDERFVRLMVTAP